MKIKLHLLTRPFPKPKDRQTDRQTDEQTHTIYFAQNSIKHNKRNAMQEKGKKASNICILFYLHIYPLDSEESDGDTIHRPSNYPGLLPEMPRYCCPLEMFLFYFYGNLELFAKTTKQVRTLRFTSQYAS